MSNKKKDKKDKKDKKSKVKKDKKTKNGKSNKQFEDEDQFGGLSDIEISEISFEEDSEFEIEECPPPPRTKEIQITNINEFIIEESSHLTHADMSDILKIIVQHVGNSHVYESADGSRIRLKYIPSDTLNTIKNLIVRRLKNI